ncbi:MAG TPA: zf-HC2 domain-containing protein [Ktedonobacterales bacterium]|nr:zf-HC2 domain-containing protein [Ktedonobacterales bacterium]
MAERELTCQALVELITSYLDDALTPEDRRHFERHLALCRGCRAYLEQMRTTLRLVGRLSAEDMPEEMRQGLLAAFRGLRKAPGS